MHGDVNAWTPPYPWVKEPGGDPENVQVRITAPANAPPGVLLPLIEATATINGREVIHQAIPVESLPPRHSQELASPRPVVGPAAEHLAPGSLLRAGGGTDRRPGHQRALERQSGPHHQGHPWQERRSPSP